MKKIILALLILCACASIVSGGMVVQPVSGGGASYSDINLYWGAESVNAEKSAGDSTATLSDGAAIDTNIKKVGSASCDFPTSWDKADFTISSSDIFDPISGTVGFYVYLDDNSTTGYVFQSRYDDNNRIRFDYYGASWALIYKGSSSGTDRQLDTTWAPNTGTWYFVQCIWGGATYTLQVKVDNVDVGNTTNTLPIMTNALTTLSWGTYEGVSADIHLDQMLSGDDPTRDFYSIRDQTSFPD